MFSRDFKADFVNARNSEFLRGLNRPQNQTFSAVANVTFLIFFVRCKRAVHGTGCFKKWNLLWILCGTKYQIREFSIRVSLLNFRDLLKVTLLLRLHNIQFFKFWSWGALIPISCAKNSAIVVWFCQNEMFGLESLCKAPGVYCEAEEAELLKNR